ncbi:MAG: AAA family ATPase [Mycobacterium sp.]
MSITTAYERLRAALENHGSHVKESRHGQLVAQCPAPAHDDRNPSLSLRAIEGSVLVHCFAGCDTDDILAAVNLTKADLYDDRRGVTYTYPDGRLVHRSRGKRFRQSGNTKGRSLYHADRIGDAQTVYVCEGEKDVHAAESVDAVAVCPAMGAGKAHKFDWEPLRDKDVHIVADRDEPGRKHAANVARLLDGTASSVRVVEAAVGKDVADHIAAGKTLDELVPADHTQAESMPRLWPATNLKPAEQPRWLAKGRLPRGAISLLVGDEGIGKSLLWVWIIAAVTTGKPLPEFGIPSGDPAHVILVCTEDDWTTTVRPRLEVAGADLAMVQVICTEDDGSGAPIFPRDLWLIAEADPAPAMVVVDAWLDTVPAMLSVRDPQQARQALHPWKEIANTTDAAVLLLCHTNRVASANARDRYGATGELRKKARMTLYAQSDNEGRLVVGPEKMNTAAPIPASTFTITGVQHFPPTPDSDGTVPLLVYAGDSERTAREHIVDNFTGDGQRDRAEVDEWLSEFLGTGSQKANDVYSAADAAGFSKDQAKRAKKRLGIEARRPGGEGPWFWSLPRERLGSRTDSIAQKVLPSSLAAPLQVSDSAAREQSEAREQGSKQQLRRAP